MTEVDAALWSRLVAEAQRRARDTEPAHDFSHVMRVVQNGVTIARAERARVDVVAIAALLHELFTLPKDHPDSAKAGDACAVVAREVLEREGAPADVVGPACEAIRDHAFSKGVVPEELEAKILQDADRLDAIGAIGIARLFATCADMKRPFYAPDDPFCERRSPDDKQWGLDHVYKKLLVIPERLHTKTARAMAERRVAFVRSYLAELATEIGAS